METEDIIKIINQEKKRQELKKNDINKGYAEIFYDTVMFERKKLCHGEFSVMFPISFDIMKEEYIALKYNKKNRPEFIYTNEGLDINITFSFLSCEEIGTDIQNEMEQSIKKLYPDVVLMEKGILETKEGVSVIQFLFPLHTDKILLIFLFFVNDKWVFGTFRCPYTQKRDWIDIIKQILLSVRLEEI